MASLIQRGNVYFVKFKDPATGKWKRRTTGTTDEEEARKVLAEEEVELIISSR